MTIYRLRQALIGVLALAIAGGAVVMTGLFLTGNIGKSGIIAYSEFDTCGQGLRVGGDVKLRGVLVGTIEGINRTTGRACRITMLLREDSLEQIPANVGGQIRAKTIFGEKFVALIYPPESSGDLLASGDTIPQSRTIDPLEVETILNTAVPLLDAIDPEHLAGALDALASGFVGHEDAAIRGIEEGIEALRPLNENERLLEKGIEQLAESGETFDELDEDLLRAMANLDELNRFAIENDDLIASNLTKAPRVLNKLSDLFQTRFVDFTKIVNQGATVVSVLAARSDDLERLLEALPRFNSSWIRNLNHVCRYRQATDEPGKAVGDRVPGRCWRVHNLISHSEGAYDDGERPEPGPSAAGPNVRSALFADDLKALLKDLPSAAENLSLRLPEVARR